jgi:hypothetical protein
VASIYKLYRLHPVMNISIQLIIFITVNTKNNKDILLYSRQISHILDSAESSFTTATLNWIAYWSSGIAVYWSWLRNVCNPVLQYRKSHLWAASNRNQLGEESIAASYLPHARIVHSDTTRYAWNTQCYSRGTTFLQQDIVG